MASQHQHQHHTFGIDHRRLLNFTPIFVFASTYASEFTLKVIFDPRSDFSPLHRSRTRLTRIFRLRHYSWASMLLLLLLSHQLDTLLHLLRLCYIQRVSPTNRTSRRRRNNISNNKRVLAMLAAMASQTVLRKLGSVFWDAFTRVFSSSDKVKRVLEGKAVVRVVDVDRPLSSSAILVRASSLRIRVCRRQRVREEERERLELGCAIRLGRA